MNLYILVGFVLGCLLGYFVFYYRFADRTLVHDLRRSLNHNQKEVERLRYELEEHVQQNQILRMKLQDVMASNTDFSKIVSELSRYYYNIKTGAEKAEELAGFLRTPDPSIEEKLLNFDQSSHVSMADLVETEKKSFF